LQPANDSAANNTNAANMIFFIFISVFVD